MPFEQLELSPEQNEELSKYAKYGEHWMNRAIRTAKAKLWVETNLEIVSEEYKRPYNCCHTGKVVYRRKDNRPVTTDDIGAVAALDMGQVNNATANADGTLTHDWLCDSSD